MTAPQQPADEPTKGLRGGAWANFEGRWIRPTHLLGTDLRYCKHTVGFRTILNAQHTRETP